MSHLVLSNRTLDYQPEPVTQFLSEIRRHFSCCSLTKQSFLDFKSEFETLTLYTCASPFLRARKTQIPHTRYRTTNRNRMTTSSTPADSSRDPRLVIPLSWEPLRSPRVRATPHLCKTWERLRSTALLVIDATNVVTVSSRLKLLPLCASPTRSSMIEVWDTALMV